MNPELLRVLTTRIGSYSQRGGTGHRPELTQAEWGAVLCGLSESACVLARYLYVGEEGLYLGSRDMPGLYPRSLPLVQELVRERGWTTKQSTFERLANVALREISDVQRCDKCNGRGEVLDGANIVVCGRCDGTGRQRVNNRERALLMGVSVETWKHTHAKKYSAIYKAMLDWFISLDQEIWAKVT